MVEDTDFIYTTAENQQQSLYKDEQLIPPKEKHKQYNKRFY